MAFCDGDLLRLLGIAGGSGVAPVPEQDQRRSCFRIVLLQLLRLRTHI